MTPHEINNAAIRLWQLDCASVHITRSGAALGLGANVVRQSLIDEKNEIVTRLASLGHDLVPLGERAPNAHRGDKAAA